MTKDNIMKLTDGLFRRVFEQVAGDYPEIASEHRIIDIGAARLATRPNDFDVVVTLNLYGDILSDIAAEVAGSIGLAASANVGLHGAMFEAVHGSAPDIAGRNLANPSGLLQAAVMMLVHLGLHEEAARIHNAWLCVLEEGLHTADVFSEASRRQVGTREFAHAVAQRLGRLPQRLRAVEYAAADAPAEAPAAPIAAEPPAAVAKQCVGIDVFVDWDAPGRDPEALATELRAAAGEAFRLGVVTNRGVRVWPQGNPHTFRTDHWRCRFLHEHSEATPEALLGLLRRLADAGLPWIKSEQLYTFDGAQGYSLAQGE
jgi:isocitrate dehydrogenase